MQKTFVKPRTLTSVLILAAVVALALVLLFTVRGKADEPGEIANFSYQTLSELDLAGDADTDLRFLFTVGSLSYDEVGFVFSKTNQLPTVGGYGCGKKATTTVYNSIIANGTPQSAGENRWWVAVKMTDIPHEYFDGTLYVRPYVDDGEIRYGEATSITVCSAAKHVHDSQLFPGCEVCELEDAKADVDFYNASDKDSGNWNVSDTYKNIRGTGYFRPHSSNGNLGNDLLIEFSILWNESLTDGAGSALDIGVGDGSDIANIYLTGVNAGKIVAKERTGTTYIYPTPAAIAENPSLKTVSLGEYGWHRLGFRVHQEAAIVNAAVKYTYIITVYLDGEMVLKYDSSTWATSTSGARLFNATIENEELKYSNNDAGSSKANTTIVDFYAGTKTYLPIADEYMTCGKEFVQDVVRDDLPEAAKLFLSGDDDLPAERWFELKGWKNETLLNSNSSDKPNNNKWQVRKTYKSICGNNTEKYYPDESNGNLGNDLLIEFSILWNSSLADCAGSAIDIGVNDESDIANIYLTGVNAGKIVAKERTGTTYVFPTPAAIAENASLKTVSLGDYGWHRIGVRVHQTAAKVDAAVQYTYIITIYLDGEMVLKYDSSAWANSTSGARLFNATIENGNLKYSPNDSNSNWASVTIVDFYAGSDTDLAIADQYMTCGKEFVQDVVKVDSPVARTTTLGGTDYSSKLWYQRQIWDNKTILNSSDKGSGDWDERPTFAAVQGEEHFYPDPSNGNRGNDLLIEFSILWNDTMATVYGSGSTFDIGVNDGSDIANIDLQSATSGKFSAKERTGTTYLYPTDPEARHPNIGANGWHRVGVRVHQEAAIVNAAVQYTYIITVYLDGEMVLKYDSSAWATSNPGALLFTAAIENDRLVYSDNGAGSANTTIVKFYKGSDNYLVLADQHMTCGKEFVRQVKPVAHPTATTDPSVDLPATVWYARANGPIPAEGYTHTGFTSSDRVTVLSYNVEKYDGGWNGRDPAEAIQTILDASPDIVGLQEVNANWNGNLATLTSNGYDRVQGDTSTDNWPELFYKTERFTKLSGGYKRYSALKNEYPGVDKNGADPSRDGQGRLFTWAMLEENATGKKILAISTHLHYRVDEYDTASSEANTLVRQYEVRLMLAWIADQSDCDAVVIVGDMNEHYLNSKGRATANIYRESGFGVARDVAAIKGDVGGTLTTDGRTNRPGYVFDLALIRGNVEVTYYTAANNKTDNAGTSYPSDHVPILTEFRFR